MRCGRGRVGSNPLLFDREDGVDGGRFADGLGTDFKRDVLRDGQHELSEVTGFLHALEDLARLRPVELFEYGPQLAERDGAV